MHMGNLSCSHQGPLAGSTPEPNRRYTTLPHNLVSRTSSALSPSLQRRISTNTSSSFYLKNKGRRFNVQLKKGEGNQRIPVISSLSDSYSFLIVSYCDIHELVCPSSERSCKHPFFTSSVLFTPQRAESHAIICICMCVR